MTVAYAPHLERITNLLSGKASLDVDGLHLTIGKPTDLVTDPLNPKVDRCHIRLSIWADAGATQIPQIALFLHALPVGESFVPGPDIGSVFGFQDAAGKQLSCRVGKQFNGPNWSYVIHIRGGLAATAWAKLYTRFTRLHVPFRFQNVPIPRGCGAIPKPAAIRPNHRHNRTPPKTIILVMPHRPSQPAKASSDNADITHWMQELLSANSGMEQAAGQHLAADGKAAVPALDKALGVVEDPIPHRRIVAVLDAIASASDRQGPLVTLNMRDVPLRTVLKRLCSQVGVTAHFDDVPLSPLARCRIERQPFWAVLRRITKLTQIGPTGDNFNNADLPQLMFGTKSLFGGAGPVQVHGACVLAIEALTRQDNLWLIKVNPVNMAHRFAVRFCALWAPTRDQLLEQAGPLHATEVFTAADGKVLSTDSAKSSPNGGPRACEVVFPMTVQLASPPAGATTVTLRGTLRMYLAGNMQTLPINNLSLGQREIRGLGISLVFGEIHKTPKDWKVPLRIGPTQSLFYHGKANHWLPFARMPTLHRLNGDLFDGQELRFYDACGRLLHLTGHTGGPQPSRGWEHYRYVITVTGGKPVRATIHFFTRTILVKIPFDFKNLPVPR